MGGLPFAAGKGVGKGVVQGGGAVVGGVGGFAGRRMGLMKKSKSGKEIPMANGNGSTDAFNGYAVPAGQASQPVDAETAGGVPGGAAATTLPPGMGSAPSEGGHLAVTVLAAKDLKGKEGAKVYTSLRLGKQSHKTDHVKGSAPEWNESFSLTVVPGQSTFTVTVWEHHNFGKDNELGEAEVDIWRHVQPAVPNADVWVELNNGTGLLRLRLDWESSADAHAQPKFMGTKGRSPSVSSKSLTNSPSRFSFTPRTPKKNREAREATPSLEPPVQT